MPFTKKMIADRSRVSKIEYPSDETADGETLAMANFKQNICPRVLARKETAKEEALRKIQRAIPSSGQALGETLESFVNFLSFAPITINFETEKLLQLAQSETFVNGWAGEMRKKTPVYLENRTRIEALIALLSNASPSFKDEFLLKGYNPSTRPLIANARPVYAALQLTGSMESSRSGAVKDYGASALFLKPKVKAYTSFTPTDSLELASNNRISEEQFSERMAVEGNMYPLVAYSMGSVVRELNDFVRINSSQSVPDHYFEAQVHMPIHFSKDVDAFAVNQDAKSPKYGDYISAARAFSTSHGLRFLDEPSAPLKKKGYKWPWSK